MNIAQPGYHSYIDVTIDCSFVPGKQEKNLFKCKDFNDLVCTATGVDSVSTTSAINIKVSEP